MLTKTTTAIAATLILGTASAALAADNDYSYGGPTQTWQDLERSRQEIQLQIQKEYHTSNPDSAYGYVVAPKQTRRGSHEQTKNR
jgi:hypothetical protein